MATTTMATAAAAKKALADCAAITLNLVIIASMLSLDRSIHAHRAGRNGHREDGLSQMKSEPFAEASGRPQGTIHRPSKLKQQFER